MKLNLSLVCALITTLSCACSSSEPTLPPSAPTQHSFGQIDATRLQQAAAQPGEWFTNGRDRGGTYYSPLQQINDHNVQGLGFSWQYALGTSRGLEATPVVVDGVMFAVGNWGRVYALNAATGELLWQFTPNVDGQWARYACCDVVNRGLAVWRGKVYVGAIDGVLYSLDATTGRVVWKTDTLLRRDKRTPYTVSGAPVIAGDSIIIGNAGGDFTGVRGYVSAFAVETGQLRWRFFTVPRDPALGPQDQPHLDAAVKTWHKNYDWTQGGGGTVWDGLAYDPELKLVYIGTDNVAPYNMRQYGKVPRDNLYAASIVAIHAESGEMAWYYQEVPQEQWDYGATQKFILAELTLAGKPRKVLMQAAKNGFFYVLDRSSGEVLSTANYAAVNWTKGIDPKTHRPIPNAAADYTRDPKLVLPSMAGAHNWQPMSYSPATGLVYIPALDASMVFIETSKRRVGLVEGSFEVAGIPPAYYDPAALAGMYGSLPPLAQLSDHGRADKPAHPTNVLRAFDPRTGKVVWDRRSDTFWDGGVLSTAGNLVIRGSAAGKLTVYAADSGTVLKTLDVGTSIMAAPMSYAVGGKQYVAVMAGFGGVAFGFPPNSAAYKYGNNGRIVTFELSNKPVPEPRPVADEPFPIPPAREGTPATIRTGEVLYSRFCSRCHVFGRGLVPDLRRLSPATQQIFYQIVLNGAYVAKGMGRWDDVLSVEDAQAIHAYIVDESWAAYDTEHAAKSPSAPAQQ